MENSTTTFWFYWSRKQHANPKLQTPNVMLKISVESFKSELEKAYKQGYEDSTAANDLFSQFENMRFPEPPKNYTSKSESKKPSSLFHSVFGTGGLFDKTFGGKKYK